jgi:sialate O-acetylesterase
VLVGEVWMCSGQSNMAWTLGQTYTGDIEGAGANRRTLRIVSVPQVGTQELKTDFNGKWEVANPENVKSFSAIGYLYGRYLHDILGVPIGLIDNAWGGSAAEAWVRRETIEREPRFAALMETTRQREAELTSAKGKADFAAQQAKHKADVAKAKAAKKAAPRAPQDWLAGNHRPGNIFAGVVYPTLGYGIKGVIWYQGESNAGRAHEYRELFPFMIEQWRREQGQGDFSFYWVQLADFKAEAKAPGDSDWAELREAQTRTLEAAEHRSGRDHRHRRRPRHSPAQQIRRRLPARALGPGEGLRPDAPVSESGIQSSVAFAGNTKRRSPSTPSAAACGHSISTKRRVSPCAAPTRSGSGRQARSWARIASS